ncbi:MAG: protein-L-isoaspartate(D-aspartate) O-methyltransferase [Ignavibacteriae bacterium]|jgi:protein-L-isoaspartate(D-aspartate) O-methyltransferase|nr:protein-L-isoaspartate(D-aspartate) O-methyltransferase [Ignavibacteriota bacterium]
MELSIPNLRKKELIEKLSMMGIRDRNVLSAIFTVKREFFVSGEFKRLAYENNALPISNSQTISQPYTVAFMTELLDVFPGCKVLEIGTGSGYQAAVLKELGAEVFSIERIKELYLTAKNTLDKMNYKVHLKCDDGTKGWKELAPFDRIIVTAGSPKLPDNYIEQLKDGGKVVIPVGTKHTQQLWCVTKTEGKNKEVKINIQKHSDFRFVPLIGEEGWK